MRLSERDALGNYFLRKHQELENDLTACRDVVRWRNADEVDCIELIVARSRLLMWYEAGDSVPFIVEPCGDLWASLADDSGVVIARLYSSDGKHFRWGK